MSADNPIKGFVLSRSYWLWFAVFLLTLSIPSTPSAMFDGLPFSSRAEFVTIAVALLTTRSAQHGWSGSTKVRILLLSLPLVALGSKAAMSFSSESSAFSACYVTDSTPLGSPCKTSFADVFAPETRTRWDQEINFGAPDQLALRDETAPWQLDFLTLGDRRFDATWFGDIDVSAEQRLDIQSSAPLLISFAVTDVTRVDGRSFRLSGPLEGYLSLTFLGRQSPGDADPYLTVKVLEGSNETPLRPLKPTNTSIISLVADFALIVLGVYLTVLHLATRRSGLSVLLALVAAVLVPPSIANSLPTIGPAGNGVTLFAGIAGALIFIGITLKRTAVHRIGGFLALISVSVSSISLTGGWGESLLRQQGDDWTTYQQFAREILATGSLRAGEDIFYFQPGYRYLLFVSRLLFGPGDLLQGLLISIPLVAILVWLGWRMIVLELPRSQNLAAGLAVASLTVMVTSDYLIRHAILGLSEPMAWLLVLAMLTLWVHLQFCRPSGPAPFLLLIGLLAGMATAVRPNYGLALLSFLVVAATSSFAVKRGIVGQAVLLVSGFTIPVLLVLAHNVWFGGSWTVVPSGVGTVYDFPPSRLISALSDTSDRSEFLTKVRGIAGFHRDGDELSTLLGATVILAMYSSWLMTIWSVRRKTKWRPLGLLLWPWLFLPAMAFFDIWIYYPRHVLALPMMLSASVLAFHIVQSKNEPSSHR